MKISTKDWKNYIDRLSKINETAGQKMKEWVWKNGFADRDSLISYAYALVDKYGSASSELACQMYDAIAEMEGTIVESAVPATTADYGEVAKAINGSLKQSSAGQLIDSVVSRLVKQQAADTTLQNALRDGAQFAWIPSGDTCSFCIALSSRGWQYASKKAIKGGHAEHIHANCDCQYAIRFSENLDVSGYDPDKYAKEYYSHEGTPEEKINAMRREAYQHNKETINEQKRAAYAVRMEAKSRVE